MIVTTKVIYACRNCMKKSLDGRVEGISIHMDSGLVIELCWSCVNELLNFDIVMRGEGRNE